jgi:hypothetical protein
MQNRLSKKHDHGERPHHRASYIVESIVEKDEGKTLKGEMNIHQTESHIINVEAEKIIAESTEQSTVER